MIENVILVDENDKLIGISEKIKAHQEKKLHRAFSILIYNQKKELLLQQRALSKYHCGGLWANTCCGHPRPDEPLEIAAKRRLFEEMGINCDLKKKFNFIYKVEFSNGLTEHEFDYVLVGNYSNKPKPNKKEVKNYKWLSINELKKDIAANPQIYTPWFKIIIEKYSNLI